MKYDRIIFNIVLILCLQDIVGTYKFVVYLVAGIATSLIVYLYIFFQRRFKLSTEKNKKLN